jgi:hypothetical protein
MQRRWEGDLIWEQMMGTACLPHTCRWTAHGHVCIIADMFASLLDPLPPMWRSDLMMMEVTTAYTMQITTASCSFVFGLFLLPEGDLVLCRKSGTGRGLAMANRRAVLWLETKCCHFGINYASIFCFGVKRSPSSKNLVKLWRDITLQ